MKIGILGGSFDPPHKGHISLAKQLIRKQIVDQIWLMPCFSHAFPEKQLSKVKNRLDMTNLCKSKNIKISKIEITKRTTSYTIDTINKLKKLYPNNDFFWIMGSDQIKELPRYKSWQEIIKNHNLIIYPRSSSYKKIVQDAKFHMNLLFVPKNIIVLNPKKFKIIKISSTQIRENVKNKKNIKNLVPSEIEKYIYKNKLYSI